MEEVSGPSSPSLSSWRPCLFPRHSSRASRDGSISSLRDDRRLRHHLGLQRPDALSGPVGHAAEAKKKSWGPLQKFYDGLTRSSPFDGRVREWCDHLIRKSKMSLLLLAGVAVMAGFFGKILPVSFLPDEDRVRLRRASAARRGLAAEDDAVTKKAEEIIMKTRVKYCTTVVGFSMLSGFPTRTAPFSSSRSRSGPPERNRKSNTAPSKTT